MPWEEYEEHFRKLIAQEFPNGAEIRRAPRNGLVFDVSWALDDSARQKKRSAPIQVVLDEDLVSDYSHLKTTDRERADQRFLIALNGFWGSYEPDPKKPAGSPVPVSVWTIYSAQVLP